MSTDPITKMMQELALRKALNNSPTLLDRAKSINLKGVRPLVNRFAGGFKNLPAVGKNIPYLNAALGTGMGLYNLSEGQNPIDAFGRPLFQVGGGILGAGTGFLADSPFSPVADIALGYTGWEGGGKLYDALRGLTNADTTAQGVRVIDDGSETGVPVTEGVGTKLVRMPDGSVRRVPIETEIDDSTVISQDGVPTDEVLESPGETISDQVSDFLDMTDWENSRRYRNSPAVRSGAFTREQLRNQRRMHEDFKSHRDAGTLEDFARAYPQSQTAKKMRRDAPYGRPVDF